jgi:PKD repeat protein
MKSSRMLSMLLLVLILAAANAWAADAPEAQKAQGSDLRHFAPVQEGFTKHGQSTLPYAPDRLLVQFKADMVEKSLGLSIPWVKGALVPDAVTGIQSIDDMAEEAGVLSIERPYIKVKNVDKARDVGTDRWFMFRFENVEDLQDLAVRFASDKSVQNVSLDWIAYPAAIPNDPLHPDHWGHNNTAQMVSYNWSTHTHTGPTVGTVGFDANAQGAWDVTYGASGVVIAIIDSGVDVGHPDLRQVAGYDYGDNDSNPDDNSASPGHGTACAGVAAAMANNGLGTSGIAGGSSIMPLKVANSAGSMYFSSIQNALYHAADNGADIISMSLGAAISSDSATDSAILYAYNAGCVILAATGNENASTISYPAINSYVIGVGAASPCGERKRSSSSSTEVNPGVSTDPNGYTCDGERWWGSNYGTTVQDAAGAVDVIAPTILPTTDIQGSGGYASGDYSMTFNGTSCATPYAAGVCALIKTVNPGWTPAQIRNQLVDTAEDVTSVESSAGWDRYSGYGMVDAEAAVGGGTPPTDPPVAAFSGTPTDGVAPLSVSFTDASANNPTSWSWNFGDGATSTAQNPSHTYTNPGDYTVTLTATNAFGSDGETKTNYISVTDPADTYATPPYSTGFEGGAVDQYWTLYEGTEGRIQVTTANTPHSGSYHLVMDDYYNGGSYSQNEAWLQLNLAGQSQVDLAFWWKDFSDETHTQDGVYFSNNGGASFTKVLDLNGASYTNNVWREFTLDVDAEAAGAGLSLTGNFVIKFQQYDNYAATTDGMAFDDISVTVGASGTAPTAAFSGTPTNGDAPLNVQFTDASIDAPTSWSWNFGDGGTSTAQNPSHTYNAAGSYTVTLTVSNAYGSDGETKTNYITVTQPGVAPTANFTGTPTSGDMPLVVQFTDTSSENPTSWSWNFGDGGTSTAQNPSHTYSAAGTYNVTLTATNAYGSDVETKNGYITVTDPGGGPGVWETITYEDFEGGWGTYVDGGGDCALYTGGVYAAGGTNAADIQDNSGVASSFYHGGSYNVSAYVDLEVEFDFIAISMDNVREDFWVQYFDGSAWHTVAAFARSTDFDNGVFYTATVGIPSSSYNYATNAKLRFMCDASGNRDDVYIDNIEFRGLTAGSSNEGFVGGGEEALPTAVALKGNFPNPFNPMTKIEFSLPADMHVNLAVYNVRGQMVEQLISRNMSAGHQSVTWSAEDHPSGVYFYRLETPTFSETRKMTMLK